MTRKLFAAAGLVAVTVTCGSGYPQPPGHPAVPALPEPGPVAYAVPVAPAPKPEPTVEKLLDEIAAVRAQKAELEKQEQALTATLKDKLKKQKDRLTQLGIATEPPKLVDPPALPGAGVGIVLPTVPDTK